MNIEYHNHIIELIKKNIDYSLNETMSDTERKEYHSELKSMRNDIISIRKSIQGDSDENFPYNSVEIDFEGEYVLEIPKYGLEEFHRTLKGWMYFKVVGGSINSNGGGWMNIRTKSMSNDFKIRLNVKTFETGKRNRGSAYIIYKNGKGKGETQRKMDFSIKKIS